MTNAPVWVHGNDLVLTIESPTGAIYRQTLPMAALITRVSGSEILRWTWDITDPEDGSVSSGAARLVLQEITDPRQTEVQPAPPADATVCTPNCDGADMCTGGELAPGLTVDEHGAMWDEAASGSPRRLADGPGCTPVEVPNESGAMVRAGSLYADKCAECTTGASCEDARRCLFEG